MNSCGVERTRERGSASSSGDNDVTITEIPMFRPEHLHYPPQSPYQLLSRRLISMVVEPRQLVTVPTSAVRIGIPEPCDNSQSDTEDGDGIGQTIPADMNLLPPQPDPVRNGSIGQIRLKFFICSIIISLGSFRIAQ